MKKAELKNLKLNNKSLDDFDKLMDCHLDKVEELEIDEISINPKLYNLIGLCTNLKQLIIKGDLRLDVNKVIFNICNPENIETLILESVKLPTSRAISKFCNLSTISLNNINFSNLVGFFERLSNPEKIIALNLTNVDFGKKPISFCGMFKNLKYLNLDNLRNCRFDNFDFIYENKKISRFEFFNNEINFESIDSLVKGKYSKKISATLETSKDCQILNELEIKDGEVSLTVNSFDLEKLVNNVNLNKISNLCVILENVIEISQYIKKLKKLKEKVTIAINDIAYFNIEDAKNFQDRLDVKFVNILENPEILENNDKIQCYSIDEYIKIRESLEKIIEHVKLTATSQLDIFNELYNYFKNKIEFAQEETNLGDVFIGKKASYNYYAIAVNSCLKVLDFDSKLIKGNIGEEENLFWNQVKIDGEWYNFDIAYELKSKLNKRFIRRGSKSNLLNDDQFYKVHTPNTKYKPEHCYAEIKGVKREKGKKIWFLKKAYQKIISLFMFNKKKALPGPNESKKEE